MIHEFKTLNRPRAPHRRVSSFFRGNETRRDQKQPGRGSSQVSARQLPCRLVPPQPGLRALYFRQVTNVQQSMQPRLCIPHRRRSLVHKYVSRKNGLPSAAAARCLQLFSGSFDECAVALPYEMSPCLLNRLAYLSTNLLACIANTFALVGFRRIKTSDIGCNLAHQFFIDTLDGELGVICHGDFDVFRDWKCNRMRETQAQVEVRSLDGRPETDTFDFQFLGEAFADSLNHIGHETTRKSVQRFRTTRFRVPRQRYTVVLHAGLDFAGKRPLQFSLRPFYRHLPAVADVHLDLVGNLDRFISDS